MLEPRPACRAGSQAGVARRGPKRGPSVCTLLRSPSPGPWGTAAGGIWALTFPGSCPRVLLPAGGAAHASLGAGHSPRGSRRAHPRQWGQACSWGLSFFVGCLSSCEKGARAPRVPPGAVTQACSLCRRSCGHPVLGEVLAGRSERLQLGRPQHPVPGDVVRLLRGALGGPAAMRRGMTGPSSLATCYPDNGWSLLWSGCSQAAGGPARLSPVGDGRREGGAVGQAGGAPCRTPGWKGAPLASSPGILFSGICRENVKAWRPSPALGCTCCSVLPVDGRVNPRHHHPLPVNVSVCFFQTREFSL